MTELPENILPDVLYVDGRPVPVYTESQIRDYGRAEYLRGLEDAAKVCDEAHELMNSSFQGAADAIRALAGDLE
jgi:hypothetical protein